MKTIRAVCAWLLAAVIALALLSGCGESEPEPTSMPTDSSQPEAPPTASPDPDVSDAASVEPLYDSVEDSADTTRSAVEQAFQRLEIDGFAYIYRNGTAFTELKDCSFVDCPFSFDTLYADEKQIWRSYLADVDGDGEPELLMGAGQIPAEIYLYDYHAEADRFSVTKGWCSQLWIQNGVYYSEYAYLGILVNDGPPNAADMSVERQDIYRIDPDTLEFISIANHHSYNGSIIDMNSAYLAVPEIGRKADGTFAITDAVRSYYETL